MKRFTAALSAFIIALQIPFFDASRVFAASARRVETLTRGMAVTQLASGTLVSWRYLGTDPENTVFKLYRDGSLVYTSNAGDATCYSDAGGSLTSVYSLEVYKNGATTANETASVEYKLNYESFNKKANGGYFDIQLDRPTETRLNSVRASDAAEIVYTPNDASVADLDGDGQYELIIKWDPSNSQDNSKDGYTSNVIIDAYELEAGDATRLWRIDLGQNIRAGAHYTQFMVYDFDGDGMAEMVCKTAPGSVDGTGNYVNTASNVSAIKNATDNTTAYANETGRILDGSEYLTLFDGKTGKALDTIYYEPARGTVSAWGDKYGNRVDRFLGGVAYLNGETPSVIMCRGYYTRSVIAAYDVVNKRLSKRWIFDTDKSGNSAYAGQGNHSLAAADVDGDGCDEIVYGAMTVDHDGTGLYTSGLGHGDALHVGDFMPDRPGLEIYQVYEESNTFDGGYGSSLKDAKTGEILLRWTADDDTGRGVGDNIVSGNRSAEFSSSAEDAVYDCNKDVLIKWSAIGKWTQNSLVYWDDDLEREVLDRTMVDDYPNGRLFTGQNVTYNNDSKSNMCVTADIFGDWREEIIAPLSDASGVRVYATPYDTDYRIYTLMHNTQYRCGVATENVGYNQPPHVDYWLGTGDALPAQPNVYGATDPEEIVKLTFDNGYNFTGFSGTLTDDKANGAYTAVSGTAAGDGINKVTFDNSGYAHVKDTDTAGTTNFVLPLPDNGNVITISGSFKLSAALDKWTFLQLKSNTGETAAVRIYGGNYCVRTNVADDKELISTGQTVSTDETSYVLTVDKLKNKTYITINGSTTELDTVCGEIRELRFITHKSVERTIDVSGISVEYTLLGDADNNGSVNTADAAKVLKYTLGEGVEINTTLADINRDGKVDIRDSVMILKYVNG